MNTRANFILICIFTIIFVLWFYLSFQTTSLNLQDGYNQSLEDRIAQYKRENMNLKKQTLQYRSYTTLSKEAQDMGFIPAHYEEIK